MPTDPILDKLKLADPLLWINPHRQPADAVLPGLELAATHLQGAVGQLDWLAPLVARLFPETAERGGIIESRLLEVPLFARELVHLTGQRTRGRVLLKADHALPVAGSVKARGGIYEVLAFARRLAEREGLLEPDDDSRRLADPSARELFSSHTISVASTGNLGLAIGVAAAALGFRAVVHMSAEAKPWKKDRLRRRGVEVIEHACDYTDAVARARRAADDDPSVHFVDDENSVDLFLGYAAAARRLVGQLRELSVEVDAAHPLVVYLPCGVGGAPGGITWGLKHVYGNAVHCFFAEPVEAPCMLVGLATGFDGRTVYDAGLTVNTEADGLAVSRASELVGRLVGRLVSGVYTVEDQMLVEGLRALWSTEGIRVEPSAAAGFVGPAMLTGTEAGRGYLEATGLDGELDRATHVLWTTGGLFVPEEQYRVWGVDGRVEKDGDSPRGG